MDQEEYQVRLRRHQNGYAPQPPSPAMPTWRAPDLMPEEENIIRQLVKDGKLPF